jgi:hypothetical protein
MMPFTTWPTRIPSPTSQATLNAELQRRISIIFTPPVSVVKERTNISHYFRQFDLTKVPMVSRLLAGLGIKNTDSIRIYVLYFYTTDISLAIWLSHSLFSDIPITQEIMGLAEKAHKNEKPMSEKISLSLPQETVRVFLDPDTDKARS